MLFVRSCIAVSILSIVERSVVGFVVGRLLRLLFLFGFCAKRVVVAIVESMSVGAGFLLAWFVGVGVERCSSRFFVWD